MSSFLIIYLQDRAFVFGELQDSHDGEWDDGAEGEHPTDTDRPRWVLIGTVRHGGVDEDAEQEHELHTNKPGGD